MNSYTDDELETLCRNHERDAVDFKECFRCDAPEKVREADCAFANDLPGRGRAGLVVIGLRDDGTSADLAITAELECQLSDIRTDGNILPLPSLLVERRRVRCADVVVLTVFPAVSPPVRYKERVWVRVGPRRAIASAQDERILNERGRYRDRPFDAQPLPSAALSDLDVEGFRRVYLPAAVAPDVLEANDRTAEQRLAAMKMIAAESDPTPTVLGVLVCGRDLLAHLPGAYVQFLRIAGSEPAALLEIKPDLPRDGGSRRRPRRSGRTAASTAGSKRNPSASLRARAEPSARLACQRCASRPTAQSATIAARTRRARRTGVMRTTRPPIPGLERPAACPSRTL